MDQLLQRLDFLISNEDNQKQNLFSLISKEIPEVSLIDSMQKLEVLEESLAQRYQRVFVAATYLNKLTKFIDYYWSISSMTPEEVNDLLYSTIDRETLAGMIDNSEIVDIINERMWQYLS